MLRSTFRPVAALAAVVSAAFLLSSCGASSADQQQGAASMHTIQTDSGEVSIPAEPKAALGFYTTDLDMLITLGVPLAKSQPIRDTGYSTYPAFFDQEALKGVTPFNNFPEHDYEAILAAKPDLILNGLGYDEKVGPKLSEIAPTYTFNGFDGSDWRTKFKTVAQNLGRTAQYEAWTKKYNDKVTEVKAKLKAANIDPVVGPIDYDEGKVSISCYGVPCLVFKDLGIKVSPLATAEGTKLSTEQLEQLKDVDVAFTTKVPNASPGEDGKQFDELKKNKLWNELPFVKDKKIYAYDLEMIYGSPSGQYAFLETVEKALVP